MSTILIVDDDMRHRELFCDVLQADGHTTLTAENGTQAVELASSATPDLILMDVQMGEMGGVEALSELRKTPALAAVPVIAVTALAMDGDKEWLLAAGFDEYVSKPVDIGTIRDVVRRHASHVANAAPAQDGRTRR